jgi:hypothetical protein
MAVLGMLLGMLAPVIQPRSASAASISSVALLPGGPGAVIGPNGAVYARTGGQLLINVTTDSDTRCVEISGSLTGMLTSTNVRTNWVFPPFTAGAGNGVQTLTVKAGNSFNQNSCSTQVDQFKGSVSYVLDNTGPVVTAALNPAPNAAGWNKSSVNITWTATDAGVGVLGTPTPATDSVTAETPAIGITRSATAVDRLGNQGTGSVAIKLDKTAPSINGTKSPAPNANDWNNTDVTVSFTCSDALSGIKSCTGGGSVVVSTEGANQSVPGTAVDNADNTNNGGVTGINIDKTAPTLSGAPTTAPNAAGWYNSDVTIHWTAADALSGLAGSAPADSTISSEGQGLTASASVSDQAGNTTNATSSPAVKVDKTAPNTTATAPTDWNNQNVTVSLNANDALSGVAATYYKLDGGTQQPGTSVLIQANGIHTLEFWSVDAAGNTEAAKTVQVKIDQTPPTINHTQSPAANANGWNNTSVTVTFICGDTGGSGIASCTGPQTVTTEGQNQAVSGTAVDNAGNTATDPATVSIDKTAPTISAAADRAANAAGWYNADVTVSFTVGDGLSGIDTASTPVVLSEGANQTASGTATDAAGNTASASVTGINIDKTAPSLSGAATTAPNAAGWYNGDVTVHWTASDALSNLAGSAPDDSLVTGEGDDLAASASVSDNAGNSANATVSGIKIDRTAPSTFASVPAALDSGWYAGAVLVTLTTGPDLSGVDKTFYKVDNGAVQQYAGPFNHAAPGIHTINYWSVDNAGNLENSAAPGHMITLQIDNLPPTITGSRSPDANGFGWNNSPVTVSFSCADAESGVAGCSDPVTLLNEGADQSVTGQAQDNAGNTANATVSDIDIDLTAPTLTGAATTNPNAFGWYKNSVTIHWTGQDGLSGIDSGTQPADSVITGEGANLGAGPVSISDKAGNVGSGSVSGIKVDRTAPTISGATVNDNGTPRSPNGAGWFNSAVRVRFACTDALSGIANCTDDEVLSTDGANNSASGTATDKAGNSANATVNGIKIDSQAPQTTAELQCTSQNGWCRGNKATVVFAATDQTGLSGVKEIRYSTNGNSWNTISGAAGSFDINLNGSGRASVLYYSVDNAGNSEAQQGMTIKYDTVAPIISRVLNPLANAAGWHKADVTVGFSAMDDSDGSGVMNLKIDGAVVDSQPSATPTRETLTGSKLINTETSGLTLNATAEDFAGNVGSDSVTVRLDKTAPTISGAATTNPNSFGWYNGPVTVKFACADQGTVQSGIAECTGWSANVNSGVTMSNNGAGQSVPGAAEDRAGNAASATVGGINIDTVQPTITVNGIISGSIYTLGAVPTASCSAADADSGVDGSCSLQVTGGLANGVGTFNYTATARDKAGNVKTVQGSYRVIYNVQQGTAFFLQPINDTAHDTGLTTSVFKAGSTVPVKFQLKDANGRVVQANSLPQWLTPARGSLMTVDVDEIIYTDPVTTGGYYRWDGQQYIYNWGTARNQAGYYWRMGVKLDDDQIYTVNIGLR